VEAMSTSYDLALHIFRRDLRLEDNTALIAALRSAKQVIACFIFDPRQLEQNEFKSDAALQFMAKSLQELQQTLSAKQAKLYFFYGIAEEVVKQLLTTLPIQAVFFNKDYTPFSLKRDEAIKLVCEQHNVNFHSHADALLHEPNGVLKSDGKPYTVFTPYMHKAKQLSVTSIRKNQAVNYYSLDIGFEDHHCLKKLLSKQNPNLIVKGGRQEGLKLLREMTSLNDYSTTRNFPSEKGTTHLSAHNKFGTISIREFYWAVLHYFGPEHSLLNELYWRDFFTQIGFFFPHVFGQAYQKKYASIIWENNTKQFRAWCQGMTGFPIVDAGMRELNTTGYMHNRVRMITASFLTKDLHIDWRWGEKYFAQKLVDYDPAVNNGNWQWSASTGCDAQPYFRVFNPWLQQQKFDPDAFYIKKWLPELALQPIKTIHRLEKNVMGLMTNYPQPIVSHKIESKRALDFYQQ